MLISVLLSTSARLQVQVLTLALVMISAPKLVQALVLLPEPKPVLLAASTLWVVARDLQRRRVW